ncbi:hypothetical protein BYT27DRAFT_7185043 [Phlegmacium glaucopus]|nr:hypothetical protein BYT27DRAFT_7185043 [Phlegmacium glaucopus]
MVDIARTLGALLVGGFVAVMFSGVVMVQCFVYFKHYPYDLLAIKVLVSVVWFLDSSHTVFIILALWDHLIDNFGNFTRVDYVPWSLALTIAFTAILTFLVHLFFVYRIYKLSVNNLFISVPLAFLACARLCFACLTTAKMIILRSLARFIELYTWSFTLGLALSSLLDVLITGFLCYLLMKNHKQNSSMNHVLDTLMLYAFENGSLTCAATVVSLICWLTMHKNLIFMGLHFVISKFYANSLMASLNTRKNLYVIGHRSQQSNSGDRPVVFPDDFNQSHGLRPFSQCDLKHQASLRVKVNKTTLAVSEGVTYRPSDTTTSDDTSIVIDSLTKPDSEQRISIVV